MTIHHRLAKNPRKRRPAAVCFALGMMVFSALLAGCSSSGSFSLEKTLPGSDAIAGWVLLEGAQTYTHETLFDYINGTSEYYFTYSFEQVAVGRYEKSDGVMLNAEVWQLAVPEDAYGLFSGRTGGEGVSVGGANEAILETGSRLVFWQERFYVTLTAFDSIMDEDLLGFAEFLSQALPTGGERPQLVGRLPSDGLLNGSVKFFHQELAIQDRLWLGGENLLGLSPETDAVYARYRIGDADWQILLVEYPDAAQAAAGLQASAGGMLENISAADTNGTLLGIVLGQGDAASADALLDKVLKK